MFFCSYSFYPSVPKVRENTQLVESQAHLHPTRWVHIHVHIY